MCEFRLVSCLEKVFYDETPERLSLPPEGLWGEEAAFQAAWKGDEETDRRMVELTVVSPLAPYIRIYSVKHLPVGYAAPAECDDNYLRKTPGLYPDCLVEAETVRLRLYRNRWESAWFSVNVPESVPAGIYPIKVSLTGEDGAVIASEETSYTLIGAPLPAQTLIHTRWFHCDGLCSYYNVKMFSEEFWRICESFMRAAADMSVNCILTPVHTPPLDTKVGGERLTCQLVDIVKCGDEYSFGFQKLRRWIELAQSAGIRYFEIAHLFTQWGALHAPKIIAIVDGVEKRIFGWETDAAGEEYRHFLTQYLAALRGELKELGVLDRCFFHISDEPSKEQIDGYLKAKEGAAEALRGLNVIDALSDIEFYNRGAVAKPVPSTNHIKPFLERQVPDLWTYYCCGQHTDVSNGFIAMPSARTRIIGLQMYKYDIRGFLQWGFNFYNSQFSEYPVNPYMTTDGDGFSPAGDCFIVYPGPDGKALPSLRAKLFKQAVQDIGALRLLEAYTGREQVVKLMEDGSAPIEFDRYPASPDYILRLRHRVNALIGGFAAK